MIKLSRRAAVLAAIGLVAVAGTAVGATAWATGSKGPATCSTLGGLSNAATQQVHLADPHTLEASDTVIDHAVVTASGGSRLGVTSTTIVVYNDVDSNVLSEMFTVWGSFSGGAFYGHTVVTAALAASGSPIDVPVDGATGGYTGKSGTYRIWLHQSTAADLDYPSTLTLCG